MYVILMKDKYGGIYLNEQILFYDNLRESVMCARNMSLNNRDTMYQLIKLDLNSYEYEEYKTNSHDIIYEGKLYTDIDKCIIEGKYNIIKYY